MFNKLLYFTSIVILLSHLFSFDAHAQSQSKEKIKQIFQNYKLGSDFQTPQGKLFWIAIPANERPNAQCNALEIYCASEFETEVEISNANGLQKTKLCKAGGVVTFSNLLGDISDKDLEVRTYGRVVQKGVRIKAKHPISVYVLSAKPVSSEGFMALPVSALGKEYISCSFTDFNSTWGNGFLVVGAYDDSFVTIKLKGKGKEYAKTRDRKKIGHVYRVKLNKGDVFCVEGDATTNAIFDLTGSIIKADKPVAVISYHQRTVIPATMVSIGYDHLSEMMIPTDKWGKNYATIELRRQTDKGDYFRVLASEDNTNVSIHWYDKNTKKLIGSRPNIHLEKKGDFIQVVEQDGAHGDLESIRGSSVFKADKPILVMQYSCSATWDDGPKFYDPFMFQIACEEQFIEGSIFQAPNNKQYTENFFNMVAYGGDHAKKSKAEIRAHLQSLKIDGTPIFLKDAKFLSNRIPTTNFYWARMKINPGIHNIYGDGIAKFGGYIYGFSTHDSYGWPAAMSLKDLSKIDTVSPQTTKEKVDKNCGTFEFFMEELKNGKQEDNPRQEDTGVIEEGIFLLDGTAKQYNELKKRFAAKQFTKDGISSAEIFKKKYTSLNYDNPKNFKIIQEMDSRLNNNVAAVFSFEISVLDNLKKAHAYIMIRDQAGNYTMKEAHYLPANIVLIEPNPINFGEIRVNTTKTLECIFKNVGQGVANFEKTFLLENKSFKISNIPSKPIEADSTFTIKISYTPTREMLDKIDFDQDSLIFETSCARYAFFLSGRGVLPVIKVEDIDFGKCFPGKTIEDPEQTQPEVHRGVMITNLGSMPLKVYGYQQGDVVAPFEFVPVFIKGQQFPITLQPLEKTFILGTFYKPTEAKGYAIDVRFDHNGGIRTHESNTAKNGSDNISKWIGRSTSASLEINGFVFDPIRINKTKLSKVDVSLNKENYNPTELTRYISIYNDGNEDIQVTKLEFVNKTLEKGKRIFTIIKTFPDISGNTITLLPRNVKQNPLKNEANVLMVEVKFHPQVAKSYSDIIKVEGLLITKKISNEATVSGQGTLPEINVSETTFNQISNLNSQATPAQKVKITNTSTSEKLSIRSIEIEKAHANEPDASSDAKDFTLLTVDGIVLKDVDWNQLSVPKSTSINIEFSYKPASEPDATDEYVLGEPGVTKLAKIIVNCDNLPANDLGQLVFHNFDQFNTDPSHGYVKGYYGDGSLQVGNIDFGSLSRCDAKQSDIILTGASSTGLKIDKIELVYPADTPADKKIFVIEDSNIKYPYSPAANNGQINDNTIKITYYPARDDTKKTLHKAIINVTYHLDIAPNDKKEISANVIGENASTHISVVTLKSIDIKQPGFYTYLKKDIIHKEIPIKLHCKHWNIAAIKVLNVTLRHKARWFNWDDAPFTVMDNRWEILSTDVQPDGGEYVKHIVKLGVKANTDPSSFAEEIDILRPRFRVMLSNEALYKIDIDIQEIEDRNECVSTSGNSTSIPLTNCVKDLFKLKYTNAANSLEAISPNPVSGDKLEIKYSLALSAHATMVLFDANGKKVKTIFDQLQNHGKNSRQIDVKNLPSGVYFIRLRSGEFTSSQKIIIKK